MTRIIAEIRIRRGTAALWTTSNPTLDDGEWGKETDTGLVKLGDGTTAWNDLAYFASSGEQGPQGPTGPQGPVGPAGPEGIQGPAGDPGPEGAPGPQGAVGPAGLNWRGEWDADTVYNGDDATGDAGASWFCLTDSTLSDVPPHTDTTNWALLASQGAIGPRGPQGLAGTQGPQGTTGPQGPQGIAGPPGPEGPPGDVGQVRGQAIAMALALGG